MFQFIVYSITTAVHISLGYIDYYLHLINDILDFYAPGWRLYVMSPFVVTFFILPMLLIIYLYLSALLLFVYRRRKPIIDAFHQRNIWEGYRQTMAAFWSGHGWIWHGYEVVGMENIPDSGSALIIYYHGAFPIDLYYLMAHVYLEKGRVIHNVVDNFVFNIPGLSQLFRFWGSFPGPRSKVVEFLKNGNLISIAPGGVREALFSENYSLVWNDRLGFAKAALEAETTILPMFTENCRQAFDYVGITKKIFRRVYERTRWPIIPIYGGFPVKMRTIIGKPIKIDRSFTPQALANLVNLSIMRLIASNQTCPPSITRAIFQRFFTKKQLVEKPISTIPLPKKIIRKKIKYKSKKDVVKDKSFERNCVKTN